MGSALYGSGGWYINEDLLQTLRRWVYGHMRRFLKMRRRTEECMMKYHERTNRLIEQLWDKHKMLPGHIRVVAAQHNWTWKWFSFQQDDGAA
eukprot:12407885-Karenia_brevis.AAC.1